MLYAMRCAKCVDKLFLEDATMLLHVSWLEQHASTCEDGED